MLWVPCKLSENPDDSSGLDLDSVVSLSLPTLVRCAAHSPLVKHFIISLLGCWDHFTSDSDSLYSVVYAHQFQGNYCLASEVFRSI